MYRTALRNVLAHKARLLMTTLAVLLGTAFVAGTMVFTDTLASAWRAQSAQSYTDIAVTVSDRGAVGKGYDHGGKASDRPKLTEDTRKAVAALPGAAEARGVVSGFAGIADRKGALIGDGFSTTGTNYVPGADDTDPRFPLADGRGPRTSGEIALDTRTAEKGGFKLGDTVRVAVNGPVMELKLTGTLHTNDPRVESGGSLAAFDTATAQQLYLSPGQYDGIDVKAKPGTDDTALLAAVQKSFPQPDTFDVNTGRALAAEQERRIDENTKAMSTMLLVFAGISLFVGIFIIANTFTMLIAQRTKELALLRAVGASRKQITLSVLAEALLVGLAASIGGLIGGIGIAAGLQALLNGPWEANLPDGPLVIAPGTVIASLLVGVAVTVLSAWLPSLRASRIAPVAAMSSSEQPATQKSLLVRNIIGLLFAVGGALGLVGGAASESVNLVGLGSGALMIGVFVLTPLLSRPVIALFAPVLRKLFGTPGKLARENAVRNPRRTAATASALTIGVTLITTLSVVGASVSKAADRAFASDIKADFAVAMDNWSMLSPEVAGQIAKTAGVTATSVVRDVPVEAVADGDTSWLTSVDAATFDRLVDVKVTAGAADALQQGKLLASKDYAERNHLTVGSTLDITYPDGTRGSLAVGALVERNSEIGGLIAPDKLVGPHAIAGSGLKKVLVKGADGATPALKQALRDATGGNPLIGVKGEKDIKAENNRAINGVLNVMYGLLGMSVIVAILGVVNTMAMSVFERRREIGMLRAIGLDRRGVGRMVRLESLMIALFGGVVGVLLGIVTAWAAVRTIAGSLKSITLVVPPVQIGFFLVAAAVIGLLAAVWPALRAARLDILGAIKSE
ncbi:ABC transporter permease [Kitasatospora purpeofusca]|uniref:ABC transporter permease n=1 Tax=Kitasatospora purpeofusca TaxID=67352 RepID=UPI00225BE9DF|nr:FtsX-like permease family protein [Kitasatospora purpeofusca]MCX4759257.1 FtsX-like permease family protein [Kitasatospora purpeofusca]WSR30344.1 FtsX-like permease family protein [Kitasatospora purpeofusca]